MTMRGAGKASCTASNEEAIVYLTLIFSKKCHKKNFAGTSRYELVQSSAALCLLYFSDSGDKQRQSF